MLERPGAAVFDERDPLRLRERLADDRGGDPLRGEAREDLRRPVLFARQHERALADRGERVDRKEAADLLDLLRHHDPLALDAHADARGAGHLVQAAPEAALGRIVHRGHAVLAHADGRRDRGLLDDAHLLEHRVGPPGEIRAVGRGDALRERRGEAAPSPRWPGPW